MNTSKIKSYAIQARRDFLKAVAERANIYGIFADDHIEPIEFKGDMAIVGERAFTKKEGELREKLVNRINRDGFTIAMQSCAYTWFNRFVALRYMEIHGYLEHGYRVLSNNGGSVTPEILEHAADIEFQGLDKDKVIELKLAGTKDNDLYRLLILAQCDDLHKSMPFLFDQIDSETELLLPDNLLHSDSPIRKLVTEIDESDWDDVEIIGWIYQFYISERKDEVIGKVVKSEDIPAATQLFTPNWIVKYMVQNTLGRMWLATYPDSILKDKMEYYIEPAEQEPEVKRQLAEITPKELNPEEITFLDPACGSGHILVEAYAVLKDIYLERGYRTRDIPRLILGKNIYGLDICDRAAQLAYFSVLMKARQDDRRILGRDNLELNVMAIQETKPSDARNIELFFKGDEYKAVRADLNEIVSLFQKGKTLGSLISVPDPLVEKIESVEQTVNDKIGKWVSKSDVQNIVAQMKQARVLSLKYDCVVTNPPYMGGKGMNVDLKSHAKAHFKNSKSDIFAMFAENIISLVAESGFVGLVMPYVWMFLSSYELFRNKMITNATLNSLVQLEYNAFEPACVPVASFTLCKTHLPIYIGDFIKLSEFKGHQNQAPKTLEAIRNPSCGWRYTASAADFKKIPGSPIAYSVAQATFEAYERNPKIHKFGETGSGLQTSDNNRFLRQWYEISFCNIEFNAKNGETAKQSLCKWFPHKKGGPYRKWYGNNDYVLNWKNGGDELFQFARGLYGSPTRIIKNTHRYYQRGITWSHTTSSRFSARVLEKGFIFNVEAPSLFDVDEDLFLTYLCSSVGTMFIELANPTLHFVSNSVGELPFAYEEIKKKQDRLRKVLKRSLSLAKSDWDSYETSWGFTNLHLLRPPHHQIDIKSTYQNLRSHWNEVAKDMQHLEKENNQVFIDAYGLQSELSDDVPLNEITLTCNPQYRYNGKKDEEELETLLLTDTMKELISYTIGCMMGRYSLDHPGLIYAYSGNIDFAPSKYKTFPADDDGIIPIMDMDWFPDDATNRFVEFLKVAWPPETLDENLHFVSESLKPKRNETSIETIRRCLSTTFFKDHLKTYKKRPIYWLFSSGNQKAFECLVYLHRYNESTLSRMRSTYVTPLQSNFSSRLVFLQDEKGAATTTSSKTKFQKEIDKLTKKQAELSKFDDELRHYADMKISLDLDDGVKANYGKFGKLLAEKKPITGKR